MNVTRLFLSVFYILVTSFTGCIVEENEKIMNKVEKDETYLTTIAWSKITQDIGNIDEGQSVEVIYEFTNAGKRPLVIKSVNASCGCTVPEKPNEPIMPGKKGFIKAVFDSKGRPGKNHKTLSVVANTEPSESHVLAFDVNVNASKPDPESK
jgi:hypothetical protein